MLLFVLVIIASMGQGCGQFTSIQLGSDLNSLGQSSIVGKSKYDALCSACHGPGATSTKAGATFPRINSALGQVPAMRGLKEALSNSDIQSIADYLSSDRAVQACAHPTDVGRTAIDRLTNVEYDNTLHDLLGISQRISVDGFFPSDIGGSNFTNEALALPMSSLLSQKYFEGATQAVGLAFSDPLLKARIVPCAAADPGCAQSALSAFLPRAFRRPIVASELASYVAYVSLATQSGQSADEGLRLAMTAALISPHFLFRVPRDAAPDNPEAVTKLDAYELASRLSYFIWSSMPDDALFASAKSGALVQDAELKIQVQRMMKSAKASALIDNFAGQWFKLSKLDGASPDPALFPEFNEGLRASMRGETSAFLTDLFQRDGSFYELVNSKDTFVDQTLANFYGISGVTGTGFQKVSVASTLRRGIAGHASILMMGSHPNSTSIVRRGKWVLQNLLCSTPPPPPPDTPAFPDVISGQTQRQRLEQHVLNPVCASCHTAIDPIGYAFENFDPLGRARTLDSGKAIDSSGIYPTGKNFADSKELLGLVSDDQRFPLCVSQMLFNFALARIPTPADQCTVNQVGLLSIRPDLPVSASIISLITSDPFRMRRGEGVKK